jgi:hypothetical protein
MFITKGTPTEFKIAPDFYSGPNGIKSVFLVKTEKGYELQTKTFCNFYYQEEKCREGDILDQISDPAIHCSDD